MSAFQVSKKHIDALVGARKIPQWGVRQCSTLSNNALGRLLWKENLLSVASRYSDLADPADADTYTFSPDATRDVVTLLKAIDCYEYQSCEHDGWKGSEAAAYCKALRGELIGCLPGYDAAPWGLS